MLNIEEKDFLSLIDDSDSLLILQKRMGEIGFVLGEDFRQTILSPQFQLLENAEKAQLVRGIWGSKIEEYLMLSLPKTQELTTLEAVKMGIFKSSKIDDYVLKRRIKDIVESSLYNIINKDNPIKGGEILRDGIEQAFMLPSRELAMKSVGVKKAIRILSHSDACRYCKGLAGIEYTVGTKKYERFHDNCRCYSRAVR